MNRPLLVIIIYALIQFLPSTSFARNMTYTYDNINRIKQVDYGNGTIVDYSYDLAGNRLSQKITAATASTGSIKINGGASYTNSNSVVLNLSATDNSGSAVSMQFSQDNVTWSDWVPYATMWNATLPTGDGAKNYYARFKYASNNISPAYSSSIILDTVAPSGSVTINNGATTANSTAVALTLQATDVNGVSQMCISNTSTCTAWEPFVTTKSWILPEGDGTKTVYASFKDVAGNINSTPSSSTIVLDLPLTTTASPAGGLFNTSQSVTLTANKAATVYYTTDGTNPTTGSVKYTAPINITTTTTLKYYAVTATGISETVKAETYTIDKDPPSLTLSTLTNGATTNNATLNVSGSVSDANGIKSLTINGSPVTANPDGSFSYALALVAGANTVTTEATDNAGNQTTDTRTISLGRIALVLAISQPPDNSATNKNFISVSGTVDDALTVVAAKVNGGTSNSATMIGSNFAVTVNLANNLNTIDITATDLAGNVTSAKRTVNSNTTAPTLAVTTPSQDISTTLDSITLSGMATDTVTKASVIINADGQTFTPTVTQDGSFTQIINLPTIKTYNISVTATDQTGNAATVQRNIIRAIPISIDVNNDGITSIADVLKVLQYATGSVQLSPAELARADIAPIINGVSQPDGKVDIHDVIVFLRRLVGLQL